MRTSAYAGFWNRFAALFIDVLILAVPQSLFGYLFGSAFVGRLATFDPVTEYIGFSIWAQGVALGIAWLYFALMESSKYQATVGKIALRIAVTDLNGEPPSFGRASGRFFGKLLSSALLGLGYVMVGVTKRKQGLHDVLAGCLVVRRATLDGKNPTTQISATLPPAGPSLRELLFEKGIPWLKLHPRAAWIAAASCLAVLAITGGTVVLLGKAWYDHVYWTTVYYGDRSDFAITFNGGNGQYLYKGINKLQARKGTLRIYHSRWSDKPDTIFNITTDYQVYRNTSQWPDYSFPDGRAINLTEIQAKQREQAERMRSIFE